MQKIFTADQVFKNGSTTYYYSSLFFPPKLREKVTTLYAFVRTVDNLVDVIPQKKDDFYFLKEQFYLGRKGKKTDVAIIDDFLELELAFDFEFQWADAFWFAMECDITKNTYKNRKEIQEYMYGSAEVIGLMMGKLMSLPREAATTAQLLGRAMQYINFIRDVEEDNRLGRIYIPQDVLKKYKLPDLEVKTVKAYPSRFAAMMRSQVAQYYEWQHTAEKGFKYLPARARIAIKTASDLYGWTAERVAENPAIVFEKKVKPSKLQVILFGLTNTLRVLIKQ